MRGGKKHLRLHAEDEAAAEAGEAFELADTGALGAKEADNLDLARAVEVLELAGVASARMLDEEFLDLRVGKAMERLLVLDVHDLDVSGLGLGDLFVQFVEGNPLKDGLDVAESSLRKDLSGVLVPTAVGIVACVLGEPNLNRLAVDVRE